MERALRQSLICIWSFFRCAACLAALSGCASGKSAQAGGTTPQAAELAAVVPRDPLELIVGAPESVVLTRAAELRGSPLFERLRPYVERATCASLGEWDDLVRATSRSVLASRAEAGNGEGEAWLLVLDGSYTDADAERVLRAASARTPRPGPAAPITVDRSGRFPISEDDMLGASLLERRLLVVGSKAWVHAALARSGASGPKLADLPLWRTSASDVRCTEQALCVLSVANGSGARNLQRGLASAGAKPLGQQLMAADSALALSVPGAAALSFSAHLPDAGAVEAAQRDLKDWLWQLGLLTRLAGLPDVLGAARIEARDKALRADLDVSESDLGRYEERAGQLLTGVAGSNCEGGAPGASPTAAAAAPAGL